MIRVATLKVAPTIVAFTMLWPAVFLLSFCEDAKHLSQTLPKIFFLDLTQNPGLELTEQWHQCCCSHKKLLFSRCHEA